MTSSCFPSERPGNKAFLDRAAKDFAGRAICVEGQALVQEIFVDWLAGYKKPYTTYFNPDSVPVGVRNGTGRVLLSAARHFRIKPVFDGVGGEQFVGCSWKTLRERSKAYVRGNTSEASITEPPGGSKMTADTGANENPFLSDSSEASSINSQNQTLFSSFKRLVPGYK
jgi:hypothetical protein